MKIDVTLDGLQVYTAALSNFFGFIALDLFHDLTGTLCHPHDARFTDEHVVGFFCEHELAGTRQGIETRL